MNVEKIDNKLKLTFEKSDYKKEFKKLIPNKFNNSIFGVSGITLEFIHGIYWLVDIKNNIVYDFTFPNHDNTNPYWRIEYLLNKVKEKSLTLNILD